MHSKFVRITNWNIIFLWGLYKMNLRYFDPSELSFRTGTYIYLVVIRSGPLPRTQLVNRPLNQCCGSGLAKFGSRALYSERWEIFKILMHGVDVLCKPRAPDPGCFSWSLVYHRTSDTKNKTCKLSRKLIQWYFWYLSQIRTWSPVSGSATLR